MARLTGSIVRGIRQGEAVPQVCGPELIAHHYASRFPFDRLVRFYGFEEINQSIEDTKCGDASNAMLRTGIV